MRIVRFNLRNKTRYGILKDDLIHSLAVDPFISFEAGSGYQLEGKIFSLEAVKLLPPCMPSKIVCLGLNYRPHAEESHQDPPSNPLIFIKPTSSIIGPGDPIILPRNWIRVDYEGELGIVIGRKAKYVTEDQSREFVFGYTCVNDVTERQLQKDDGQWTRSKSFDTFAPIGPWIETEIEPDNLKIQTYLNGELRQTDFTRNLIFGISTLISFISNVMTLLPGDIISTGTPAGIAPMKPGDTVEVKIENIGILRNPVQAPQAF